MRKEQIFLHETDMFKKWLSEKGYKWPRNPIEQEDIVAEFQREGLEKENEGTGG